MSHPLQTLTRLSALSSPSSSPHCHRHLSATTRHVAALRVPRVKPVESLYTSAADTTTGAQIPIAEDRTLRDRTSAHEPEPPLDGDEGRVSGIHVPRQKYISVSKADLLDAILSTFESEEDAREFARFAEYLDSVLHAENKVLLEEMRLYHSLACLHETAEPDEIVSNRKELTGVDSVKRIRVNGGGRDKDSMKPYVLNQSDTRNIFSESLGSTGENSSSMSRIAAATQFQRAFLKLLKDAQFEEISAQDLLLTRALNTDYLLTLPIYVDWKRAFQSNSIIFRRGYTAERQKGMLLVEKLDYLQSKLLQRIFHLFSKPVKRISIRISEAFKQSGQTKGIQDWMVRVKTWLADQYFPQMKLPYIESIYTNWPVDEGNVDNSFPLWLAAQKAVPLYEGLLSSIGPRGRLMGKLLGWIGLIPSLPEMSSKLDNETNHLETYLRPTILHRVTLSDIWKPATKEYCGNNLWKMLKSGLSILFSQSYLQEPAFQELILLYTEDVNNGKSKDKEMVLPLLLKIYERIPIPDLPVIFPHKKLSFRILDTIRLDAASILGLLAFLVNYKFETVISSPSAFLLDLIAISALIIYATRVALGYKQTWDRYQLLVNKTLYEKTLASGFGSVHFLLDASEQQLYKEAILSYAVLLHSEKYQAFCRNSMKDACERFLYTHFRKKVEMPIENALGTLLKLELIKEDFFYEHTTLGTLSPSKACDALKRRWLSLLSEN